MDGRRLPKCIRGSLTPFEHACQLVRVAGITPEVNAIETSSIAASESSCLVVVADVVAAASLVPREPPDDLASEQHQPDNPWIVPTRVR